MRSPCCLCVCMCISHIVARQQLSKHVPPEMNTHANMDELLDALYCMRSMSYQRKLGD
jgi:hypothetical protein